jgi:hypothetical protein
MPTISSFYGILIRMYCDEHGPPHFHVNTKTTVHRSTLNRCKIRAGDLPRRALNLVLDWAELHLHKLRTNWTRIEKGEQLSAIRPLE